MSRAPKHRVGTVVSREWAARIETERRALITPEQREQQQQAAEQHKRHEAAGVTCADCDTACQFKGRNITACGDRFTPKPASFCDLCTLSESRYVDECGVCCCSKMHYGACPAVVWNHTLRAEVMRAEYVRL